MSFLPALHEEPEDQAPTPLRVVLKLAVPVPREVAKLTVPKLRAELEQRGLDTTGLKAAHVDRLTQVESPPEPLFPHSGSEEGELADREEGEVADKRTPPKARFKRARPFVCSCKTIDGRALHWTYGDEDPAKLKLPCIVKLDYKRVVRAELKGYDSVRHA